MISGDKMSKIVTDVLAGLGKAPVVRLQCIRTKKFARELQKELKMCVVQVEQEDSRDKFRIYPGVIRITWRSA